MSPLPITGTPRSAATLPTRSQSAALLYRCSRVRPWIAMASAPFSSQARATSDTLTLSSCQPARSLTVTGMETAAFMAATSRPTLRGLAQQARPQAPARDLVDRAAAVEVHEARSPRLRQPGPLDEGLGPLVRELNAEHPLVRVALQERELARAAAEELLDHRHLPDRDVGAHLGAEAAERQVAADGERREDDRVLEGRGGAHGSRRPRRTEAPAAAGAAGSAGSSTTASPSPGARNRFVSSPCCRSYISR